ncbi:hypothetical protein [Agrococcus casei]|uniref:hypothetical protein n=1 Tax=Agrococcus casei TaxID=343512 RepID=UPI00135655CF|nr:hypothetical protein [Agrococcus casei]
MDVLGGDRAQAPPQRERRQPDQDHDPGDQALPERGGSGDHSRRSGLHQSAGDEHPLAEPHTDDEWREERLREHRERLADRHQ